RTVSNDPGVELKQLSEKLCRLISHSSVTSSLPSLKSGIGTSVEVARLTRARVFRANGLNEYARSEFNLAPSGPVPNQLQLFLIFMYMCASVLENAMTEWNCLEFEGICRSLSSNGMPSAKVSDGSFVSLSSLNGVQSREKTQEEKQKEVELYKELKKRKNELEEKLLAKLDELREVCIKEAEITGELPKEIYKTLMPGEEEPKVKRRVGTAFSLSEVFKRPVDSNDRISMLEADVELHRKIVAAAERLAKDKTTNKSVRKKRQKDLIAATQKLRGLEFGLTQLRLSASKPDVSTAIRNVSGNKGPRRNCSDYQMESTLLGTQNDSNSLITKSCPATPRGSFPDLLTSAENERSEADDDDDDDGGKRRASTTSKRVPPPLPYHTCYFLPERQISWEKLKNHNVENHHIPVYENVGYKSCVSYKSSYREMNFPTLNDHTNCKDRVQRAFSDHDLPEQESVTVKNSDNYESRINYVVGSSRNIADYGTTLKQPSWKYHFGQENSRDICIEAGAGSSDAGRQIMIQQQQNNDEIPSSSCLGSKFMSSLETYQQSSSSCNSPPIAGLLSNDGKTPLRYAVLPASRSYNDGFTTASLDRRAMKERQLSCGSVGYHQLRSTQLAVNDMVREICIGQPVIRHSPLSTPRFTTTFPVSGPASMEKSKPLLSSDIHHYQHRSPLQQRNSPEHSIMSPRNITQTTGSSSNLRPPPPAYPVAVRNGIFGARNSLGKIITAQTDLRMDAMKNYYKDKSNERKKNATAV
ncbi:unnamed protein product, partial [Acanthocheilonema viteae]